MNYLITNEDIIKKKEKVNQTIKKFEKLLLSKIGNSLIFELKSKRKQEND